jgi:hypothetical protein
LKGRKGEGAVEPFAAVIKCTSDLHRGDGAGIKSVRHRIGLRCARVNDRRASFTPDAQGISFIVIF